MYILLIEPDSLQAHTYSAVLEDAGHAVACVHTAQDAVQHADEHTPDLVILELQLPGHNGIEFLYEFRSYPEWLHIPVIVHTFIRPEEFVHVATLEQSLGIRCMLYKPTTTLASLRKVVETSMVSDS